jgi:Osmosensitive K+ channel histidine kinase
MIDKRLTDACGVSLHTEVYGFMNNARNAAALYLENSKGQLAAKLLALCRNEGDSMSVVGVFPECGEQYAERTEELFRYSSSIGANLTVLYSTQPAAALLEYVRSNAVTDVVISEADSSGAARLVSRLMPEVAVTLAPADGSGLRFVAPEFLLSSPRRRV